MNFKDLNPFARYAMRTQRGVSYEEKLFAYDYRLFYILENECTIEIADQTMPLRVNDLLIFPPKMGYRMIFHPEKPCYFVLMDFDLDNSYYGLDSQPPEPDYLFDERRCFSQTQMPPFDRIFLLRNKPAFREALEHICDLRKNKLPNYNDLISAELKLVLLQAVAAAEPAEKAVYPAFLNEVKAYLEQHCTEPVSNEQIAALFGYHSYYLNKLFSKYFGQTMHAYLNKEKLRRARQLLLSTDRPIIEIATECGFRGAAWFSEYFKANTGLSPSQYRKRGR